LQHAGATPAGGAAAKVVQNCRLAPRFSFRATRRARPLLSRISIWVFKLRSVSQPPMSTLFWSSSSLRTRFTPSLIWMVARAV